MKCEEETWKSKQNFWLMTGQPMMPIVGGQSCTECAFICSDLWLRGGSLVWRNAEASGASECQRHRFWNIPHSRVLQPACLLENSRQSGIANWVCLVSFVACQHDVMKNNFTSASNFLLFRFLPPPPNFFTSFLPSYFCSKSLSAFSFRLVFNLLQRPAVPVTSQTVLRVQ